MARKFSDNSPGKKTGGASSSSTATKKKLMGDKIVEKIEIRGYPLTSLDTFSELDYYPNAIVFIASTLVVITLLCQLRALKPDSSSAKLDQSPAFKFYKKRVLLDSTGKIAALFIAISQSQALACLPTSNNMEDLDSWLMAIIDTYQGNEKSIEKASTENIMSFVCGQMSRLLGLFNSCPASNMAMFGLSTACVDWGVSDVLKAIPVEAIQKLDPAVVINQINKDCSIVETSSGDSFSSSINPTFDEPPYTGSLTVLGGCKLELEIFGKDLMPIRSRKKSATLDALGGMPENNKTDLEKFLNKIELKQYESALKVGKKDVLTMLNKRVIDRMNASRAATTPTAAPSVESSLSS